MKNWIYNLAKRVTLSLAPPRFTGKGVGVCWIPGVSNETWHTHEAFTNLVPKGTLLKIHYLSRGFQHREIIVLVRGPRKPVGPTSCDIQLSESAFRVLENPNAGTLKARVEGIA